MLAGGLFGWPCRYMQILPQEAKSLLRHTAACGVSLSTHYSGIGCMEASMGLILQALDLQDHAVVLQPSLLLQSVSSLSFSFQY